MRMRRGDRTAAGFLVAVLTMSAGVVPASDGNEPAPKREWGNVTAGLRASIQLKGSPRVGGELPVDLVVENIGSAAVPLGEKPEAIGWAFVLLGAGQTRSAYYTAPIALPARAAWPDALGSKKQLDWPTVDLANVKVYPYVRGVKIVNGYPDSGEKTPKSPGTLGEVLRADALVVRVVTVLPRQGGRSAVLTSNTVKTQVNPPAWKNLTAAQRAAYTQELLKRFDKDAWSGQQAHHAAVKVGKPLVAALIKAARQADRPAHSRLWLTTALADIRDKRAAEALADLLTDKAAGVRYVVAYHGPKQRSKPLDAAILKKTTSDRAEVKLQSFALLGFLVHRGTVPEKLVAASLESNDPKVRATAAGALSKRAGETNLRRLVKLLGDENARVAATAAKVLGAMGSRRRDVIGGMIGALDQAPDSVREAICASLVKLLGRGKTYDVSASDAEKKAVVKHWRDFAEGAGLKIGS
ncbi:MAG: HEAT repeat domain-containing protein [Phycisphaerae bacterium]